MELISFLFLSLFAFAAGFIDSIVGGGGLIQMPALLVFAPSLPIPTIMGTNKLAAFSGTAISTIRYTRETPVPWKSVLPAIFTAIIFSFIGAHIISLIHKENIKIIVLVLLTGVAIYTFLRKNFGIDHLPKLNPLKTCIYSLLAGAIMGFYDGFFGPGTGSFLIVIYISVFGFNFLIASASAKLVNCATNISALSYFIYSGQVDYKLALPVAFFNMFGNWIGSKVAINKGSRFVRSLFLIIVSGMILKFGYDVWMK